MRVAVSGRVVGRRVVGGRRILDSFGALSGRVIPGLRLGLGGGELRACRGPSRGVVSVGRVLRIRGCGRVGGPVGSLALLGDSPVGGWRLGVRRDSVTSGGLSLRRFLGSGLGGLVGLDGFHADGGQRHGGLGVQRLATVASLTAILGAASIGLALGVSLLAGAGECGRAFLGLCGAGEETLAAADGRGRQGLGELRVGVTRRLNDLAQR